MNIHEGEDRCKHDTASGEGIHRLALTVQTLHDEYKGTNFFKFRKRAYISGMIMAFGMAIELMDSLARKYDNTRGTLN